MIEIVSIGTELLSGLTVNTNASELAHALLEAGYQIRRVTTVPDRHEELKEGIKGALQRADIVITTGGLGPTGDDMTRSILAEIFETELCLDLSIEADLKKRYGHALTTLQNQATVIKGAEILPNSIGTAPGCVLKKWGKLVVALPGVPVEMWEMLRKYVIPHLIQTVPREHFQRALYLFLTPEQRVDPYLRIFEERHPDVSISLCPSAGILSVYFHVKAPSQREADHKLEPILSELRHVFKDCLFSETGREIESAVYKTFTSLQKTFACSESCTGGQMSARLTQISGASEYFLGGLVTYSNELKQTLLCVNSQTLESYGAVSRETVVEMASGTLALTGADYAIAVSGIAGPTGGSEEKPLGTVWGAIAQKGGEIYAAQVPLRGKRPRLAVIDYAVTYFLCHLWRFVELDILPFEEL